MITAQEYRQFIGGSWTDASSGATYEDADPYTGAREPDAAYPLTLAHAVRDRADLLAPCRWAVVVPPAGLGMVRKWAELTRDSGVAVAAFAAAEDALAWLGAGTAECRALSPAR